MKFSLDWLRDHVEIDLDAGELVRRLTTAGFAVEGLEPFGDDLVLEVEVTSNRPDCMNHRGLAREIAASTGRSLRVLEVELPESPRKTSEIASVRIADPDLCSRYTARIVLGVSIGPSPDWVQRRLRAIGIIPKWNVVDASNYVLFDVGHPLHTFDLSRLEGRTIIVRRARPGERLTTVADGTEHTLDASMLVIADASRPAAIAGVMGGLESGISESSRDILVESAWFDPVSIRRTARALGMRSDASHRFERGADPEITLVAADRLCRLVLQVAGGECLSAPVDVIARTHPARRAPLRRARLAAVLGAGIPDDQVENSLERLGFPLERTREGWSATIPSHRPDIEIEEDLIEEAARSVGYDFFPSTLPTGTTLPPEQLAREDVETRLREVLSRLGFNETIGYSMIGREEDALFSPEEAPPPIEITNPLSERWEVMRRCMLPGLVKAAQHNVRHGQRDMALFELGTIFHGLPPGTTVAAGAPPFKEERTIGLLACGRAGTARWNLPHRPFDVFDLTGAAEGMARELGQGPVSFARAGRAFLHPGQSMSMRIGSLEIGFGGALHPELTDRLELPAGCAVAQLSIPAMAAGPRPAGRFHPLPRYPAVSRDISALVPEETPYAEVERVAAEALAGAPARLVLVDRYAGPPLPPRKVSLTFNVWIQPVDRTLAAEEIDDLMGRLTRALEERAGAEIRR